MFQTKEQNETPGKQKSNEMTVGLPGTEFKAIIIKCSLNLAEYGRKQNLNKVLENIKKEGIRGEEYYVYF